MTSSETLLCNRLFDNRLQDGKLNGTRLATTWKASVLTSWAPLSSSAGRMSQRRTGFTLIELLIVVVIIGVLAAIAIPKFQSTKGKAYMAAMKSDLRNLSVSEEGFYYTHRVYTTVLDSVAFSPSHGDSLVVHQADATGWSATSSNPEAYPHLCAIFYGAVTPVPPATTEGQVACQ